MSAQFPKHPVELNNESDPIETFVWENSIKEDARRAVEDFNEKLIRTRAGVRREIASVKNCEKCNENRFSNVFDEIPLHIVCGDMQWDIVDWSLRR